MPFLGSLARHVEVCLRPSVLPRLFTTCSPKGTYSNKEGSKICTPCPVNTYSDTLGVYPGTARTVCTKCPVVSARPGWFWPASPRAGCVVNAAAARGCMAPSRACACCGMPAAICPHCLTCMPAACPVPSLHDMPLSHPRAVSPPPLKPQGKSTRGLTGQSACQVLRPQARRLRSL
mgnify:CR=1 FL=1